MKRCPTCGAEPDSKKIFCDKICYLGRRNYRRQSEETRKKIAAGNSKPMSSDRKEAISRAKMFVPPQDMVQKLHHFWSLRYLNPLVVMDLCGIKGRKALYNRLHRELCSVEQHKFMPADWYPEDYQKLIELTTQGVWYQTIAKMLSSSLNQITNICKKLNLPINTRKPDAWSGTTSKLESDVISWIRHAGHDVDTQFHVGNFYFDGHVKGTCILVEVNGDYWHCNPKVYTNGPVNDMQKRLMRRDFAKKSCAKLNGYKLITVWENDVRQDAPRARDWLLKKVKEYGPTDQD